MELYSKIVSRVPIHKGWSGDRKFRAETASGEVYLLRIADMDRRHRKEREYQKMQEVAALGIPMCLPLEFGLCDEGVYTIHSWIHGTDAEEAVMALAPDRQ